MDQTDIEKISAGVVQKEKKSFLAMVAVTILGGLAAPLLIWIFMAGSLFAQVTQNTKTIDGREEAIDSIPVIQNDIDYIKKNAEETNERVKRIEQRMEENRKELIQEIRNSNNS